MLLTPQEYIGQMEQLGFFTSSALIPEHNTKVWHHYLSWYESLLGGVNRLKIVMSPQGLGFYQDPLYDEALEYGWALLGPISHPTLPFTSQQLLAYAPAVFEVFTEEKITPRIITETFDFNTAVEPTTAKHFLWLNSPRAYFKQGFTHYISSLSSSRRQALRQLFHQFDNTAFKFVFSTEPPNSKEIDFILENLKTRWGEKNLGFALVQSLWAIAVAQVLPKTAYFMRVYHFDHLMFLNTFIVKNEVIICQSTCKDETQFFNGLGIMIDFKVIQLLADNDHSIYHLDSTCRTSLEDPETIGIAKRKVINENALKPILLMGSDLPQLDFQYPYLSHQKMWFIPDNDHIIIIGKTI